MNGIASKHHASKTLDEAMAYFNQLKSKQFATGKLFTDPDFLPRQENISSTDFTDRNIVWKRPSQIHSHPALTVGGISRFDVRQGELGNCYFLAAVSSLTLDEELFKQVVPLDQSFEPKDGYCGMFMFRFWRYGLWQDVIIDDYLPTVNNRLLFMYSIDDDEFWSPLLEKAFAKLQGSYGNLIGGRTCDVMVDFTGGLTEMVDLQSNEVTQNLFDIMNEAKQRASLMALTIEDDLDVGGETENGLIKGHAYAVTGVKSFKRKSGGTVGIIRLRNPWGEGEWNGAWGDDSPEWLTVYQDDSENSGMTQKVEDDGEFWMAPEDIKINFSKLEMCHLSPKSIPKSLKDSQEWNEIVEEGEWKINVSAGGCRNYINTYHTNPQYRFKIGQSNNNNGGLVIVSLMQNPDVVMRPGTIINYHKIGYAIYKVPDDYENELLDTDFFKRNTAAVRSKYSDAREVCFRHLLPPSDYIIIVGTFEPNQESKFMLRIFSVQHFEAIRADEKTSMALLEPTYDATLDNPVNLDRIKQGFYRVSNNQNHIYADQLQFILNDAFVREFKISGFSLETCRCLISSNYKGNAGKLNLDEFIKLRSILRFWKTIFKRFDEDNSGEFSSGELRGALAHVGFKLNTDVFAHIVARYATSSGEVTFDDFCLIISRLKVLFNTIEIANDNPKLIRENEMVMKFIDM